MAGHCDKSPHDRTNERGRQIETAPSLGRKRPRRPLVQATYVPVLKGPLANSKRATDVKRGQHHTVKGSASGTIPPLRGFTFRWGWSRSHGFGGAPNMGWGAGIGTALNTKRCGGKRKGSRPRAGGWGVGSGPASHQKKHQVNAAWCVWFQSSKKSHRGIWVPCNQQPSLTVCDGRAGTPYMPLAPAPMRNFGGGVIFIHEIDIRRLS
jgi:hypothetical protein